MNKNMAWNLTAAESTMVFPRALGVLSGPLFGLVDAPGADETALR